MDVMQNVVCGQKQSNKRVFANVHVTNPAVGNGGPVVTQVPLEGGPTNMNVSYTFHVFVHGGSQGDWEDHHDDFFIPRDKSLYEPSWPSPTDLERRF